MSLIHFHLNSLKDRRGFITYSSRMILLTLVYVSSLAGCGDTSNVSPLLAGPGPLSIATQSPLPSGTVNQPYATVVGGSGGITPYTWNLAIGSPPCRQASSWMPQPALLRAHRQPPGRLRRYSD